MSSMIVLNFAAMLRIIDYYSQFSKRRSLLCVVVVVVDAWHRAFLEHFSFLISPLKAVVPCVVVVLLVDHCTYGETGVGSCRGECLSCDCV